jgi:hypothetical protein
MDVETMQKPIRNRLLGVCAAVLLLAGTTAHAALLNTGTTLFPAPAEANPSPGATQVTSITVPFASPGAFTGSLTSTVFTNDTTNPFGSNRLTFVYQLSNAAASNNVLARLVLDSFGGFQADASYQTGTGVAPTLIDRLTNPDIGFSFLGGGTNPGPLRPGDTSARLVVQTNATLFGASNGSVIDGAQVNVSALGPFVPEPASLGVIALAGLALIRRR